MRTNFGGTTAKIFREHSDSLVIGVMGCILFFSTSTRLIFYSLHRIAVETPKAPMGTTIAVFSTAMNLFGFLGSLAARAIHF